MPHRAWEECSRLFAKEDSRSCSNCNELLPPSFFSPRSSECHSCLRARRRKTPRQPMTAASDENCPSCYAMLEPGMFNQSRLAPDGLSARCKICINERGKARYRVLRDNFKPIPVKQDFKPCTRCHKLKSVAEFSRVKLTEDGRVITCKFSSVTAPRLCV